MARVSASHTQHPDSIAFFLTAMFQGRKTGKHSESEQDMVTARGSFYNIFFTIITMNHIRMANKIQVLTRLTDCEAIRITE